MLERDRQVRDDYQELIELTMVILGSPPELVSWSLTSLFSSSPPEAIHWISPGPVHHAR